LKKEYDALSTPAKVPMRAWIWNSTALMLNAKQVKHLSQGSGKGTAKFLDLCGLKTPGKVSPDHGFDGLGNLSCTNTRP
jgi:hypothetical protein